LYNQLNIFSQGGEKMNTQAINTATIAPPRINEPVQRVEHSRETNRDAPQSDAVSQNKVQPEELLNQIKALTDDGQYSVRFEKNDDLQQLVVKIVNQETDEVVRQIPSEELINLSKYIRELQGNIVDTVS
jgi:flagellar protein FlaG